VCLGGRASTLRCLSRLKEEKRSRTNTRAGGGERTKGVPKDSRERGSHDGFSLITIVEGKVMLRGVGVGKERIIRNKPCRRPGPAKTSLPKHVCPSSSKSGGKKKVQAGERSKTISKRGMRKEREIQEGFLTFRRGRVRGSGRA